MTTKRDKTLGLMEIYFFFGPPTLANLEPSFSATVHVPLGEATVPRDGWAPERGGGLNSHSQQSLLSSLAGPYPNHRDSH